MIYFIYQSISPSFERSIAIDLVESNFEKMMIMITVIGTLIIIPITPQKSPHKDKDIIVTNELMFIDLPTIFGSNYVFQ